MTAAAVLVVAAAVVAVTEQPTWVRLASVAWLAVAVGALLEVRVARVEILADGLLTRSVLGVVRRTYGEIAAVKLEDGQLHLRTRDGSWQHLPSWLAGGQAQSARAEIAKRLKAT